MRARQPYLFNDGSFLVLAHEDFSDLITNQSPVRPGEKVHAYAVGLGAVTPAVATGVLFAGLAPGMIGIYQIDIRMPSPLPGGDFLFLNCGTPGNDSERHGGYVPIPRTH